MTYLVLGPLGGKKGVETSLLRELITEARCMSERVGLSEGESQGIGMVIDMLERRLCILVTDTDREFQAILARGNGHR